MVQDMDRHENAYARKIQLGSMSRHYIKKFLNQPDTRRWIEFQNLTNGQNLYKDSFLRSSPICCCIHGFSFCWLSFFTRLLSCNIQECRDYISIITMLCRWNDKFYVPKGFFFLLIHPVYLSSSSHHPSSLSLYPKPTRPWFQDHLSSC